MTRVRQYNAHCTTLYRYFVNALHFLMVGLHILFLHCYVFDKLGIIVINAKSSKFTEQYLDLMSYK